MSSLSNRSLLRAALLAGVVLLTATAAHAEDAPKLDPYLTDSTVAVLQVHLEQIDPLAVKDVLGKVLPLDEREQQHVAAAAQMAEAVRKQLLAAGLTDVVLVVDLEHILQGPYLLFRYKPGSNPELVRATLSTVAALAGKRELPFPAVHDFGGILFNGSEEVLALLQEHPGAPRPALDRAWQETEGHAVQLALTMTDDQRRILADALPPLPAPFETLDGRLLARAVQFAAFGFSPAPELKLRLVIESADAEAATVLKAAQEQGLEQMKQHPGIREAMPGVDELAALLTFQQQDRRLTLSVEQNEAGLKALATNLLLPALDQARGAARRDVARNNLKQFMLAMHNYHQNYNVFPAHANYSPDGKPLLSWRVHILPYIDQAPLYQQFHLDEPWDSEHNRKLIPKMPQIYAVPGSKVAGDFKTGYVYPIPPDGSGITTGTKDGIQISEIIDGLSNTIMIVEADDEHSVIWTKPEDLLVDLDNPLAGLSIRPGQVFLVAICDGSVHTMSVSIDPQTFKAMLTRNGKEVIER